MTSPDADADAGDRPADAESEPESAAPAPLSVDQLTQAFAQLMGHDEASSTKNPSDETPASDEAEAAPGESADTDDETDDTAQVTPAAIVESVLFVGHPQNEALSSRQIASYLRGVSPQEIDALVQQLNQQYVEQRAPYRIASVGAGYRMTLCDEFRQLRDGFYGRVREAKLSQGAVDLLAIVAYHQPISREHIDRLRGQPSGGTLSQLVRRQLLQVEISPEKPRRKSYRTTDRFLDVFGLESLEDLPSQEDF